MKLQDVEPTPEQLRGDEKEARWMEKQDHMATIKAAQVRIAELDDVIQAESKALQGRMDMENLAAIVGIVLVILLVAIIGYGLYQSAG